MIKGGRFCIFVSIDEIDVLMWNWSGCHKFKSELVLLNGRKLIRRDW